MALSIKGVNTVKRQESLWTNAIIWHQIWAQVTARRAAVTTQQLEGELTSLLSYLPGPRSLLRDMAWGSHWLSLGGDPSKALCLCLPSNLSQHFTKHVENHLTHTALCLDPARPCPLHNLLLFILCSELISSLFTFSGRHSPNTLTPCSSSLSCPLSKNYVPFL